MTKEEKYTIALASLSILLFIAIVIIFISFKIMEDLNYMIDVHKNTIGVCNVDLKQVQKENEELRKECLRKPNLQE